MTLIPGEIRKISTGGGENFFILTPPCGFVTRIVWFCMGFALCLFMTILPSSEKIRKYR